MSPATIIVEAVNHVEIAVGAPQVTFDLSYSPSMDFSTWKGFDEVDEITGSGHAELLDDGSIEITAAKIKATTTSPRPHVRLR